MGRVIRIGLAALVVYAVWQTGAAYWQYLQLQDRVERIAQFGAARSHDQVRQAVVAAASELGVVLDAQQIGVRSGDDSLSIDAAYTRRIEILPRLSFSWTFTIDARAWLIPGAGIPRGDATGFDRTSRPVWP